MRTSSKSSVGLASFYISAAGGGLKVLVMTIKLLSSNKLLRRSISSVTCRRASNRHWTFPDQSRSAR